MKPSAPTNKQNNLVLATLTKASRPGMLPVETGMVKKSRGMAVLPRGPRPGWSTHSRLAVGQLQS